MKRRDTDILSEKLAKDFLKKRCYHIMGTNYRCPKGEIDIVAKHKDYLVFIEVRTKKSREFGSPKASIAPTKQERLRATASYYYQAHDDLPSLYQIATAAVDVDQQGKPLRIELVMNTVGDI